MVEMIAAIALMAILMAMTASAFSHYWVGRSVDTSVTELTSQIREAQSLAVATGNTYRIDFSDPALSTYTLQRRSGSEWVNVRAAQHLPGGVTFSASSPPAFGSDRFIDFYARGNSESGQLTVTGRFGLSRTLTVDGETVNVR
jgi:type II secretory pathway pseudopilin PulG